MCNTGIACLIVLALLHFADTAFFVCFRFFFGIWRFAVTLHWGPIGTIFFQNMHLLHASISHFCNSHTISNVIIVIVIIIIIISLMVICDQWFLRLQWWLFWSTTNCTHVRCVLPLPFHLHLPLLRPPYSPGLLHQTVTQVVNANEKFLKEIKRATSVNTQTIRK